MKRIGIVTGASSGLGYEYARQLAATRKIDEIWLFARRQNRLEALSSEISRNPGAPGVKIFAGTLSGKSGVTFFEKAVHENRDIVIDTLVNNAGFGTYGPFEETPVQNELDMIDLNVYALTGITHTALPFLQEGSRIINVASLAAFIPLGNFAVYAATKAYVLSFSCGIGAELADRGVTVTAVCPGPVSTEFAAVASNGARKEVLKGIDPARVVAHSLKCAKRGKHTALLTLKWKFKAFMSRFMGRYFFARYTYVHEKRPHPQSGKFSPDLTPRISAKR